MAAGRFDADLDVAGEEAAVFRQGLGCRGGDVELWRLDGSGHLPDLTDGFRDRLLEWLATRGARIFDDGFETGTLEAWSASNGSARR